jgi:regulator of sigma E protease
VVKFTLFFLSLSLLIVLHEFGHYITARWFKARVDKFYLFFDFLFPFSNLLKFSIFKKKIGQTEYGIGWFPFGGFVDIAGMMADPDKPNEAPAHDEFRGKKPWQRLIILAGGVTVNALLAVVIYSMMLWSYGQEYLPTQNAKYGIACDSLALAAGFKDGDKIVSVDGQKIPNFQDAVLSIILDKAKTVEVDRNGQQVTIDIADDFDTKVIDREAAFLITPQIPFVLDSVVPGMPGAKGGLKKGDSLISLNGDTLVYFQQFLRELPKYKGKTIELGIVSNGAPQTIKVTLDENGKMQVLHKGAEKYLTFDRREYGFFAAWGAGFDLSVKKMVGYVKQLRFLFTKEGASKMGGFASIGSLFPSTWDWEAFWSLTAYLSLILAFMNLLPIPVLDGGYILFVLWEMITGKKVSDKVMATALNIGMYIVLGLLVFANGNDIYRFLIK